MKTLRTLFALLFMLSGSSLLIAQDNPAEIRATNETDVYVTTQDFSSVRVGPGIAFERITVAPPAVTLPAVGRTPDTHWIQIIYEGQRGWIAQQLLVWSGNITSLPVDTIEVPFVRRAGVMGTTTRLTPIYRNHIVPADQVGFIPAGTPVELTGRLGSSGFFRFQVVYEGQLYWVGSWNIRLTGGSYLRLVDTAYLFPYGRLAGQLERDINQSINSLSNIEGIWQRLQAGEGVSCGFFPRYASRNVTDVDVQREQLQPVVTLVDNAITHINTAISAFVDACGRTSEEFFLTQQEVRAALAEIDEGRHELVLAISLLNSLQDRNPLLSNRSS